MRFLRAYIEGIYYFKTNREGSIRALQKFFRGATAEQIAFLYDYQRESDEPLPVPTTSQFRASWTVKPTRRPRASGR